mmetsp:Transcript_22284/g.31160  ORF Transcript_22284/g.31160 Transcript_22284/m.31160 type:complete len:348 (+) Transcript_22284:148-1191(+)
MTISACMYPALVLMLIVSLYSVYVVNNLLPQVVAVESDNHNEFYEPSAEELWIVLSVFHFLLGMLLLCFTLACVQSPGYIPLDHEEDQQRWMHGLIGRRLSSNDETKMRNIISDPNTDLKDPAIIQFLRAMGIVERKRRFGYHRHCSTCSLYKPDRTHHCRVCKRCILRMDHHCPWIANCVGFNNYKTFLLLLIYTILTTTFMIGSMMRRVLYVFRRANSTDFQSYSFFVEDIPVLIVFGTCIFITVAFSMFLSFHIKDPFIQHRFRVAHIKFDKGKWENFLHVFGSWYLWVLPIRNTKEDGTYVDYWGEMKGANAIASKDGKIHDSKDTSDNDEYIKDAEGEKLFS